jgi:hypothetical protein
MVIGIASCGRENTFPKEDSDILSFSYRHYYAYFYKPDYNELRDDPNEFKNTKEKKIKTEKDIIKLAKNELKIEYNQIKIYYDKSDSMHVRFIDCKHIMNK